MAELSGQESLSGEEFLSGQEFHVGLAMAGAISAGAYSAGVFDFLIQALEAWETARRDKALAPDLPNHRVGIKVIAGASAGAMTGGLGVVALASRLAPEPADNPKPDEQAYRYCLRSLYDSWVVKPAMLPTEGRRGMLDLDDLDAGKDVPSALNSLLLDDAVEAALHSTDPGTPRPYVADKLHVYFTLSNLRGVPYSVEFSGGAYGMMGHGDRAHYVVSGIGTWPSVSAFADNDQSWPVAADELFEKDPGRGLWHDYGNATIASGAFPLGLSSRQRKPIVADYIGRNWPSTDMVAIRERLVPKWPDGWTAGSKKPFPYTAVDGGLLNNEPFEFARYALMTDPPEKNLREGKESDRAVLMIDPFPEAPVLPDDGKPAGDLLSVASALFSVLRAQTQFKPSEVAAVGDTYSRFMVAPHRSHTVDGTEIEDRYAIASGLLGGFGGFFDRSFRDHDFQLGRRNCQKFLRDTFCLTGNNPIIKAWPQAARDRFVSRYKSKEGEPLYRIIPLVGDAAAKVPLPSWPRISEAEFERTLQAADARWQLVAKVLTSRKIPNKVVWLIARSVLTIKRGSLSGQLRYAILSDLVRRDQIEGWTLPSSWKRATKANGDEIRAVLAAFLSPSVELRNAVGIATATRLPVDRVQDVIETLLAQKGSRFELWQAPWTADRKHPLYALASRKPSWAYRLLGIRQAAEAIAPTSADPEPVALSDANAP